MAALAATVFSFTLLLDPPRMQLLVTGLLLAGALLVGAVVLALVRRWWGNRAGATDDLSPSAQLAQFRSLYEAGEISQEEFERLRALLGARLREEVGVAPPEPKVPAQPPPGENGQPPPPPPTDIRPA